MLNSNMNKIRKLGKSFYCAGRGFAFCLRHERNLRIHLVAAAYVFAFSFFYNFSRSEYILLTLTCTGVIAAELFNTAIEVVIDKVSPKFNIFAMIGKDIAAGAVLVTAVGAVATGVFLFWDTAVFGDIFRFFTSHWLPPLILIASVGFSILFIFRTKKRSGNTSEKPDEKERNKE